MNGGRDAGTTKAGVYSDGTGSKHELNTEAKCRGLRSLHPSPRAIGRRRRSRSSTPAVKFLRAGRRLLLQCAESATTARCVVAHSQSRQKASPVSQTLPKERRHRPIPTRLRCKNGGHHCRSGAAWPRGGLTKAALLGLYPAFLALWFRAEPYWIRPLGARAPPIPSLAPPGPCSRENKSSVNPIALAVVGMLWARQSVHAATRPPALAFTCRCPPPFSHQLWPTTLSLHVHASDLFGLRRTSQHPTKQISARVTRNRAPGNEGPELRGSASQQAAP